MFVKLLDNYGFLSTFNWKQGLSNVKQHECAMAAKIISTIFSDYFYYNL